MVKAGWGRVVNIASNAGVSGYGYSAAYCAAKHAMVGFTRALAIDLARTGVTINALCPGWVHTKMSEEAIARIAAKTARYRTQFPTPYDSAMDRSDYLDRKRERIELECVDELRRVLFENAADLNSVERRVLDARFALDQPAERAGPGGRRKTLDQVGALLGVSKERVRQIQNQAMGKLRAALEQRLLAAS